MYNIYMLLLLFLQTLWLALPAAVSNMVPPIATKIIPTVLNIPVDFSKSFRGKRILGNNKTLRGLLFGIFAGEIVFVLQQMLYQQQVFKTLSILSYSRLPWYFGFLFGIGALGGDMVKSFAKRQLGIPPGKTWIPFDQVDWIVGLLIVLIPFVAIPMEIIIFGFVLGLLLHMIIKFTGFLLGLDKQPI